MPLRMRSKMEQRLELVERALTDTLSKEELSRRAGVCRKTLYNWIRRYQAEGATGLTDRSTAPRNSPGRTPGRMESMVLAVRDENPCWGARKISRHLEDLGHSGVPAVSTTHGILLRHGRVDAGGVAKKWKRFERDEPMDLLQMDFKGHFATEAGRCHPLTVLDDHSRYLLGLESCADEKGATVKRRLTEVFRRYGLPRAMITDNGPPWGVPASAGSYTGLGLWLIRLGIELKRAGEYHPQTMGKVERLHRTLKAEVLQGRRFTDLDDCQGRFDRFRHKYNYRRPHQGIGMSTPSKRFKTSLVAFPESMPEIEYGPDDEVRKVQDGGLVHFRGEVYRVGTAFRGLPVAVRLVDEGEYEIYCVRQNLLHINLRAPLGGHKG